MGKASEQKVGTAIDWIIVGTSIAPVVVETLKGLVFGLIADIPDAELDKKMIDALQSVRFKHIQILQKTEQPVPSPEEN
jgi:hypothetical protein